MDKYTFYKSDAAGALDTYEFEPTPDGAVIRSTLREVRVNRRAARKTYRRLVAEGYSLFDGAVEELRRRENL